jgi:hypothetical protein
MFGDNRQLNYFFIFYQLCSRTILSKASLASVSV